MASKKKSPTDAILRELRAFGLAYPGAHSKSPWPGHDDLAVNDKTFAYLSVEGEPLGISCKLPKSSASALLLPFCEPTGYGLGKSGWVSARFGPGEEPPVEMLKAWIDESYRAQAPKKLVAQLGSPEPGVRGQSPREKAGEDQRRGGGRRTTTSGPPAKRSSTRKPRRRASR